MKFSWKNFPEMLLTHDPKSEILKKAWKNFPRNPLSDHPVFGNIFQDLAIWVKQKRSNFILSNLELSNSTFQIHVSRFLDQNCETTIIQTSVEYQSLLGSILTRMEFLPNFTSILPWIRAKVDKTKDTT